MTEFYTMNIFQKMLAITAECPVVKKDITIDRGEKAPAYKAVSDKAILDVVVPLEQKYGVYSFPIKRTRASSTVPRDFIDQASGTPQRVNYLMDAIETTYRFVNADNPDDFVDMISFGTGMDRGDKGAGKGMTYSDKYALINAYKIRTTDDAGLENGVTEEVSDIPEAAIVPLGTNEIVEKSQNLQARAAAEVHPETEQPQRLEMQSGSELQHGDSAPEIESASVPETKADLKPRRGGRRRQHSQEVVEQVKEAAEMSEKPEEPQSVEKVFTPDEARQVVVPFGRDSIKGKTLGELLGVSPDLIKFYATSEKYSDGLSNRRYPEVRAAAQILLNEAQNRL